MRTSFVLTMLLAYGTPFFLPRTSFAESVVAESIEWVLTASDRVAVGKVVKVDQVTGTDKKDYQVVTAEISTTMKGEQADRVAFLVDHYINKDHAKHWMDEGIPLLFCLVKNDGKRIPVPVDKVTWVIREDGNNPDAVLLGKSKHYWTGCIPVLTRDFDVLTDKETILRFLGQTLKASKNDRTLQSCTCLVPGRTAVYEKLWALGSVRLIVPVDEKLETLGRSRCSSESSIYRKDGAKILRHFKNDKNVAILRMLLSDNATSDSTSHELVRGQMKLVYRKKEYPVRQAAFAALRELGVKVDKPVLEELLEGSDDP
ncbi:MAG: hypothetical protein ACJ8FY_25655 [Gemmataceae bacterium]